MVNTHSAILLWRLLSKPIYRTLKKISFRPQTALHDLSTPHQSPDLTANGLHLFPKNQTHLQKIKICHPRRRTEIENAPQALKIIHEKEFLK